MQPHATGSARAAPRSTRGRCAANADTVRGTVAGPEDNEDIAEDIADNGVAAVDEHPRSRRRKSVCRQRREDHRPQGRAEEEVEGCSEKHLPGKRR